MGLTKKQIDEIDSKVCFLALYNPICDLRKALSAQIKYLGDFLGKDEKIIMPVFTTVNWPGSKINKGAGTMIFFTDKRIFMGYKYFFGLVHCLYVINYSECEFFVQPLEPAPIKIKTKHGTFSFSIKNKAFLSDEIYEDYYCSSYYLGLRISQLILKSIVENCTDPEAKKHEAIINAKKEIQNTEKTIYKRNDFHKALCFCAMHLKTLSEDDIKFIMTNGYDEFIKANPDLGDLPDPSYYYAI